MNDLKNTLKNSRRQNIYDKYAACKIFKKRHLILQQTNVSFESSVKHYLSKRKHRKVSQNWLHYFVVSALACALFFQAKGHTSVASNKIKETSQLGIFVFTFTVKAAYSVTMNIFRKFLFSF